MAPLLLKVTSFLRYVGDVGKRLDNNHPPLPWGFQGFHSVCASSGESVGTLASVLMLLHPPERFLRSSSYAARPTYTGVLTPERLGQTAASSLYGSRRCNFASSACGGDLYNSPTFLTCDPG